MNPEIIDTSISLELAVADLYLHFHKVFPQDSDFWWKMSLEEKGHAAILRSARDSFMPVDKFPAEIIMKSHNKIKKTLSFIIEKIEHLKDNPISRKEAFELSVHIENTSGELHYQEFMTSIKDNEVNSIFKRLNGDDKDHAQRIEKYMKEQGI